MITDERLRDMTRRKYTIQEISDLCAVPYSTVHKRMKELGLPVTKGWQKVSADERCLIWKLLQAGRSYSAIGRTVNRSKCSIAGIVYRMKHGNAAQNPSE